MNNTLPAAQEHIDNQFKWRCAVQMRIYAFTLLVKIWLSCTDDTACTDDMSQLCGISLLLLEWPASTDNATYSTAYSHLY